MIDILSLTAVSLKTDKQIENEYSWEMWSQLPELILTNIFHYLDCEDRVNVGKTCQSWGHALASPILWRCVTISIDRDLRSGFPLATEIAVSCLTHLI